MSQDYQDMLGDLSVMDEGWAKRESDGGWFVSNGNAGDTISDEGRRAWMRCMLDAVKRQYARMRSHEE